MPPSQTHSLLAEAVRLHQAGALDRAAQLYRNVLAAEPDNADALHLLGFLSHQDGRPDLAVGLIRKAIARKAREAVFHFHLGLALKALGQLDEAAASYRRALNLNPNDADTLNNLGNVLSAADKVDEAAACYRRALAVAPGNTLALVNLGNALSQLGRLDEAEANYRQAIALAPGHADAHNNLGDLLRGRGAHAEALASFRTALALAPGNAVLHNNLGLAQWELGGRDEAISSYRRALALDPVNAAALENLAGALWQTGDAQAVPLLRRLLGLAETAEAKKLFVELAESRALGEEDVPLLVRALREAWGRPARLARQAAMLLKQDARIGPLVERARQAWPERPPAKTLPGFAALAENPLLMALLVSTPNIDMGLERFLAGLRGAALGPRDDDDKTQAFLAALAQQCFINEYVFLATAEETQAAEHLRVSLAADLAAGRRPAPSALLAAACFFPLVAIPGSERLPVQAWPEPVHAVLAQQVAAPLEEARLKSEMPRLTPIADEVSRLVRDQYEENPYPRWVASPPASREALPAWLARKFPLVPFQCGAASAPLDILIAGCGTGQHSIATAQRFGDAGMLAVDLSLSSLAYAKRKSGEQGLSIAYGQADILKLGMLGRDFDLIESVGVLHHMADPYAGWGALLPLLRPGGFLWLGFYSAEARRGIMDIRARIAGEAMPATPDSIRRFRQQLAQEAADPTILESEDFFSISACRDLLFHAHEHGLTLKGIASFLAENGLIFLGFDLPEPVLDSYRRRFPQDRAATDLANWAIFEQENPGLFAAMYVFWVQKPATA